MLRERIAAVAAAVVVVGCMVLQHEEVGIALRSQLSILSTFESSRIELKSSGLYGECFVHWALSAAEECLVFVVLFFQEAPDSIQARWRGRAWGFNRTCRLQGLGTGIVISDGGNKHGKMTSILEGSLDKVHDFGIEKTLKCGF